MRPKTLKLYLEDNPNPCEMLSGEFDLYQNCNAGYVEKNIKCVSKTRHLDIGSVFKWSFSGIGFEFF